MGEQVACKGQKGKKTLGRHKLRWEGNIKMDVKETNWERVDWIYLVSACSVQVVISSTVYRNVCSVKLFDVYRVSGINSSSHSLKYLSSTFWKHCT